MPKKYVEITDSATENNCLLSLLKERVGVRLKMWGKGPQLLMVTSLAGKPCKLKCHIYHRLRTARPMMEGRQIDPVEQSPGQINDSLETESGLRVCSVFFNMEKVTIAAVLICLFITACKDETKKKGKITPTATNTAQASESNPDSVLLHLTQDILTAFKTKNYSAVADFIDPVSGIRFSPYGYIDTIRNVIFSKEKFAEQAGRSNQDKIIWGEFDGSGDTINMTLNEYIAKFVYDVDFSKPETRKVNEFIGHGNSLNNLLSVYKDCDFTESHFSGFEKKYEGMDWRSIRLIFRERDGKFFLVGIVHDQWTS